MVENKDFKEKLKQKILSYKPDFNIDILNKGLEKFQLTNYRAGDFLVTEGTPSKFIFFAEETITRCYFLGEDGVERTLWIEPQMSFITEYESFNTQIPSKCNIHIYQDSSVCHIDRDSLYDLYADYHDWAQVGIAIIEHHFVNLFKLTTTINFNDASENYKFIDSSYSNFLDVVPMKHLASWLNISPVHLSRIRKESYKIQSD